MKNTFKTVLRWHDSRGGECEAEVRVTYSTHKGFAGSRIDPPEPDDVEITDIVPVISDHVIPDRFYEDDELIAECFEDWSATEEDAAEWRAQAARDDALMERCRMTRTLDRALIAIGRAPASINVTVIMLIAIVATWAGSL